MADVTAHDPRDATGEHDPGPAPRLPRPELASDPEHRVHKAALAAELFDRPAEAVRVGPYRICRRLGQGSMGTVYLADDERLGRQVALKLLHEEQYGPRLQREAHALARLSHPNVVQVFEVGVAGGRAFVAMEYVPGQTLHAWLRARPRPWREVLAVLIDAGRGLQAVHAAGLVHRDFKPGNVVLGDDGRARVFDFGLARSLGEAADARTAGFAGHQPLTALTQTGGVVGTPAYMAPEQFHEHVHDARSDQFSFCVALFEALYGVRPFDGPTLRDLYQALQRGRPVEPPAGSQVPAWLHAVVVRGLARDPAARWPSMTVLLAELGRDRDRARRRWFAGACLGLGALALGLVVPLAQQHRHRRACEAAADAELAEVWRPEARAAVLRARGITAARPLGRELERAGQEIEDEAERWRDRRIEGCVRPPARVADATWLQGQMQRCFDAARRDLATNLAVAGEATGPRPDRRFFYGSRPERCLDPDHLVATTWSDDPEVQRHEQAVRTLLLRGEQAAAAGDLAAAEQRFTEAVATATADEAALALAGRGALARVRFAGGDRRGAWQALEAAFFAATAASRKLPVDEFAALDLQIVRGAATGAPRRHHLALLEGHDDPPGLDLAALVRRATMDPADGPWWRSESIGIEAGFAREMLAPLTVAAGAWAELGELELAEDAARHGLAIAAVHAARPAVVLDLALVLARAYLGLGLEDRAEEALGAARAVLQGTAEPAAHHRRGWLQLAFVELRLARGDRDGAARELDVLEDMSKATAELDDRFAPALALARGRLLASQGDPAGAARELARAREGLAASHGLARLALADVHVEEARLALAGGRPRDAEASLREALREREALVGPDHASRLATVALLGLTHHALGDFAAARDDLARARTLVDARLAAARAHDARPDSLPRALARLGRPPEHGWAFRPVAHDSQSRDPELRRLAALLEASDHSTRPAG
ncbi:Serine/threonine protein kinase [Nannocystis exedens]|uniref:Serine/threonine protein kinase n=2 Tax=Nannocystis exedens TaxID=54 RepID=A0A1I2DZT3_9BACT|nr:Serine/threonine-protein kinase PK-1 [Nannocystis exedens]SFE85490.1 Serine/threonine protein kinase [Nannocystis exedens]